MQTFIDRCIEQGIQQGVQQMSKSDLPLFFACFKIGLVVT